MPGFGGMVSFRDGSSREIASRNPEESVFTEDLSEFVLRNGRLVKGRILSGDERNAIAAGEELTVLEFTLSRHK